MSRFIQIIAAAALTLPVLALPTPGAVAQANATAEAATLTISFTDIEAPNGRIMLGLFEGADGYNGGKPVRGAAIEVSGTTASTVITGLAPGQYGAKLFHDVNGNGKMDTNPFGMPIEPFAFSNSAKGNMGPATWDAAAFEVKSGSNAHTISFK
jgi:uncharacterized protein (DUF2141 family)